MFVMAIIIAAGLTFAIYYFILKKKGTGNTDNSKTVQDYVTAATPGEQAEAKALIDTFKSNPKEELSEKVVEAMIEWTESQLAWGATYYKEQTGRSLTKEVSNLTIWGWTSVSLDDNDLINKLKNLGIQE